VHSIVTNCITISSSERVESFAAAASSIKLSTPVLSPRLPRKIHLFPDCHCFKLPTSKPVRALDGASCMCSGTLITTLHPQRCTLAFNIKIQRATSVLHRLHPAVWASVAPGGSLTGGNAFGLANHPKVVRFFLHVQVAPNHLRTMDPS